jgi:protein-disulfide isomerase
MKQIEDTYVTTGKVKIAFKQFPLTNIHQNSEKAAEASLCANDQGKFWEMHNKMFENNNVLDVNSLKGYAKLLGLNTNDFNTCLDSGKYADQVQKDQQEGIALGITGTPSFIINGKLVTGALPFSEFQKVIDAELAQ